MNTVDWMGYLFGFHQERLLDWASVLTFGQLPSTLFEVIFAQVNQLAFSGFVGIVFAYILLKLTSGHDLFKGWLYGLMTWFFIYAASIIVEMPYMEKHSAITSFLHAVSSSAYGITLALTLRWLEQRVKSG